MIELLKKIGIVKIAMAFAGLLVLIIAVMFVLFTVSSSGNSILYSDLSGSDSNKIINVLNMKGIQYETKEGGAQILVPADKVLQTRMIVAEEGLPSSGNIVGYEIFDKSETLGSSAFVQDVNIIRALEGELARTIMSFDIVEKARIHLVIPKKQVFSNSQREPTASVALTLTGSSGLNKTQVAAISHLVATAVPGLKPNKITIVDNKGKTFKLGGDEANDLGASVSSQEEYVIAYQNRVRNIIEELVEKYVGQGRVQAQVNADIDFDRVVLSSEKYDPEGSVVRSVQSVEEKESSNESDSNANVTVANNLPAEAASGGAAGNNSSVQRTEQTTNYEVSKIVTNHVKESGSIKKLSIAVLIDGKYVPRENILGGLDYEPRTDEELERIKLLVASAVGLDEARGDKLEVINMQFSMGVQLPEDDTFFDMLKQDLRSLIQTVIIGVIVILVILLVIKPMVNRAFELSKSEVEEEEIQGALAGQDILSKLTERADIEDPEEDIPMGLAMVESKIKKSSMQALNDVVSNHPTETVSVLRNWLYSN